MERAQIHFELFVRKTHASGWTLELATEDRTRAIEGAEEALTERRAVAVRVTKETLDEETREFKTVTILTKGEPERTRSKAPTETLEPLCVSPQDLYTGHARERIGRLLEAWLVRNKATPFELLHRADLIEKLDASGLELQHAVQKVAIPEAQARSQSVHEVIRNLQRLVQASIDRVLRDARKGTLPTLGKESFAKLSERLVGEPERHQYFNATLRHNGSWVKTKGYVSDVLTNAAIQFIEKKRDKPFFVYLPFNCPHAPHQVPQEYRQHYRPVDFANAKFPRKGHPMALRYDPADLARVYGMIENIDDNVGRLLAKLDELQLAENTIVVLFSDNGCQKHNGYNAGFQGWKGTPFEGGIHQFCFVRWPAQLKAGHQVGRITAHIDLAPTLLDLCGIPKPERVKFDGLSLAPLLRGEKVAWPDRVLFFQWHRGDAPERYRAFAARSQDWKLVQPLGSGEEWDGKTAFKLYDMAHDPLEEHDLAAHEPERVARLKAQYDAWFTDVTAGRDYNVPSRIFIGSAQENPVLLTRQDWRGDRASWQADGIGYWDVNIVAHARFDIKVLFDPLKKDGEAALSCGNVSKRQSVRSGASECLFRSVQLPYGPARLEVSLVQGAANVGAKYVEVKRIN